MNDKRKAYTRQLEAVVRVLEMWASSNRGLYYLNVERPHPGDDRHPNITLVIEFDDGEIMKDSFSLDDDDTLQAVVGMLASK